MMRNDAVLLALFVTVLGTLCNACSCYYEPRYCKRAERATVLVKARVKSKIVVRQPYPPPPQPQPRDVQLPDEDATILPYPLPFNQKTRYKLKINRVFKGGKGLSPGDEVWVETQSSGALCGASMQTKTTYLVDLYGSGRGAYSTGSCSLTTPWASVRKSQRMVLRRGAKCPSRSAA